MKRPPLADQHQLLAATAKRLLADRQRTDPALVEKGKMTADAASARARIMSAIADQWTNFLARAQFTSQHERWLNSNGREGASLDEMRETLEAAAKGAADRWRKEEADEAKLELACAIEALLWWQLPEPVPYLIPTRIGRMHADDEYDRFHAVTAKAA